MDSRPCKSLVLSLHAAVHCSAEDRQALEHLCRHITRPAMANERVQCSDWRHGRSKSALRSLVPRPRLHLIRFHGLLAPNAKLRAMVVPPEPEAHCAHHRPVRLSWARLLKRVFSCDITWVQISLR